MRGSQLVVPDDEVVGDLDPARGADEVLGLDAWIAEEVGRGRHGEKGGSGHVFPARLSDCRVVDEEGGRENGG